MGEGKEDEGGGRDGDEREGGREGMEMGGREEEGEGMEMGGREEEGDGREGGGGMVGSKEHVMVQSALLQVLVIECLLFVNNVH